MKRSICTLIDYEFEIWFEYKVGEKVQSNRPGCTFNRLTTEARFDLRLGMKCDQVDLV